MWLAIYTLSCLLLAVVTASAQPVRMRADVAEFELRPKAPADVAQLEIIIPDVASGRVQRRPVSDLMLRVSVAGGDVAGAMLLPNGAAVNRDAGLVRAQVYVVTAGRLLPPVEARCDRWIEDFTVCSVACDGGVFGIKRRVGAVGVMLAMAVGRLPRGFDEGARAGFNLNACDTSVASDQLLAPAANRGLVEMPLASQ
ncbi:MAG: hypothetical protein ABL904_08725 [Hyphomicrobiaceae bacterium]